MPRQKLLCPLTMMLVALLVAGSLAPAARADANNIAVTAAGAADGFSIGTVVDGFNPGIGNGCCGPLGVAVNSAGNIVVDASNLSKNFVFNDVNGQTLSMAISSTAFNAFPPAFAESNGAVWGSGGSLGRTPVI